MATAPNLGYNDRSEVNIDTYNQWQRSQPWYQDLIRSFGQDPNNVHLSDAQKQAVIKAAQANGVVVDEGGNGQEVDDSGNFKAKGHKLRNTLIVAGIAGAALATMGAAGVFAGAGGAASGAGAGAGAAGAGAGASSAGAGLAGLAGVEGGAAGLDAAGLAALGTGAMGAVPVGAGVAGAAGAGLGADAAFDAAGNFIGPSTVSSTGGGSGIAGMAGRIAKIGQGVNGIANAVTGQDDALAGNGAANAAAQAAKNRAIGAQIDQGGPGADKTALSNMRWAGLVSNFHDTPTSAFGNPAITIGDPTRDMARKFQAEMAARMANGKSLTLSGVPDPSAQELQDDATARAVSQGKSSLPGVAGQIVNGVNTGTRLAGAAKNLYDLWSSF